MSQPIAVDILSDDDSSPHRLRHVTTTPVFKRQRLTTEPTILVIEDDPTPVKPPPPPQPTTSDGSFVAETPFPPSSDVAIIKCTSRVSLSQLRACGSRGLIFLESDNESEKGLQGENPGLDNELQYGQDLSARFTGASFSLRDEDREQTFCSSSYLHSSGDGMSQVDDYLSEENDEEGKDIEKNKSKANLNKDTDGKENRRKRATKQEIEERDRLKKEKKQQREQEKLQKAAMKAEAAELKKLLKERQKWEKGKFALKSIVAEVDTKVVELGSVGGNLLTRFAEKGLTYRITSNPIQRSIVWNMTVPEEISQLSSEKIEIPYVLLIFEAEEFCDLVMNESLVDHVSCVRRRYPSHTICYLTNKLMSYINKREQSHYKNPERSCGWRRPPVEEVLSKLATHFVRVHSRLCIDEAEVAEHVVGLTCSLASCQHRQRLTRLSVSANGSLIPKDCLDKHLIKKDIWLKALVAIPKVQPRFALAIWKKYPTMRSLLSVYLDPHKSVHEKEFLLKDLRIEGLLGEDIRLGEVCSKRVYRVLMAECGTIKTDDVELGADLFHRQSSSIVDDEANFSD